MTESRDEGSKAWKGKSFPEKLRTYPEAAYPHHLFGDGRGRLAIELIAAAVW